MDDNKIRLKDAMLRSAIRRDFEVDFKTNFNFLKQHNGWRNGKVHTVVGSRGTGKSTLTRSIVSDIVKNNPDKKIAWWLSEEEVIVAEKGLFRQEGTFGPFMHLKIASELESINGNIPESFTQFINQDIDFFIFDNLSTSAMYKDLDMQVMLLPKIKALAIEKNIPILLIVHTKKDKSYNDMIEATGSDIMGSGMLANIAEFLYIIHEFRYSDIRRQFMRVEKHRDQFPSKTIFRLEYCETKKHHIGDTIADYESVVEIRNMIKEMEKGKRK